MMPSQIHVHHELKGPVMMQQQEIHLSQPLPAHEHYINVSQAQVQVSHQSCSPHLPSSTNLTRHIASR